MLESGVERPAKLTWLTLVRSLKRWHAHFFATFWVLLNIVALPDGIGFQLWLKSSSPAIYSIEQVNNYPTIQSAVGIVAQIIAGGLSDSFSFHPFLAVTQCLFIISYSSLAAWSIPVGWRWFCYMIIGFDGVNQALVSGWINRTCRRDAEERAFVLAYSDAVSQAMNIWTNIVFYPTLDAPEYHLGYIISTVAAAIMLFLPILERYLQRWFDTKVHTETIAKLNPDSPSETENLTKVN